MRERWIVALAVCYFIIIIGGALFVGLFALQAVESQISRQAYPTRQPYPTPGWVQPDVNVTVANVTVYHQDDQLFQGEYKPYVITTNITAQDYHSSTGASSLRIKGYVNNTGGGTAYEGALQVVAMNNEGKAIDTTHSFVGVTAYMSIGLDFSLQYNGSAIVNCTIKPLYIDAAHLPWNNQSRV